MKVNRNISERFPKKTLAFRRVLRYRLGSGDVAAKTCEDEMNIYLGSLNIKEMEARTGVAFPAELVEEMEKTHQSEAANVKPGHWHCFDIPFMLVCGDRQTAKKIYSQLSPLASEFAQSMQIGIQS